MTKAEWEPISRRPTVRIVGEPPASPSAPAPANVWTNPPAVERRALVLLLDDDPMMRDILRRLVARIGADAIAASNPSEALYLLSSSDDGSPRRGIALLDVLMPHLDGQRFVQALRSDHRFSGAPIVLVSGLSAAALQETLEAWNADAFIQKSRGLVHLSEAVEQWVARLDAQPPFVPRVSSRPPRPRP